MLNNLTISLPLLHHDPTPGHGISQKGQTGLFISRFYPNNIAVPRGGTIQQFTMQVEAMQNSYVSLW